MKKQLICNNKFVFIDPLVARLASIHMPANWPLVYKMVVANGPKTIISVHNRAVLVLEVVIAAVLQLLIVQAVVLMGLQLRRPQMVMVLRPIWVHYLHHPAVFSIPHQVSIVRQQILFFIFKWFLI